MNRAIWKGVLRIGKEKLPVSLCTAVQDKQAHFHLLHKTDLEPVHQRIVRKSDGEEVPAGERLKAYPLDEGTAVMLSPEDLEGITPKSGKDISVSQFVSSTVFGDQWYDRPYYVKPESDAATYFALASVLKKQELVGIGHWGMREKRYLGALTEADGYLALVTLRWADQVLDLPTFEAPKSNAPSEQEMKLARQLVDTISGEFDPSLWQDEYREKLWALIRAKAAGKVVRLPKARPKASTGDLTEALRKSLKGVKGKKVA